MLHRAVPPPTVWVAASAPPAPTTTADTSDAVQLDPFYVQEDKLPDMKERHLLTAQGKIDLAKKRHPGLNVVPFLKNDIAAREIIEDEFQKERNQEMKELSGIQRMTTPLPPRRSDWINETGTPFRPPK